MRIVTRRAIIRLLASIVSANAVSSPLWAGVPARKATYRGGTLSQIRPDQTGELSVDDPAELRFVLTDDRLEVAYSDVRGLEYGQKAGRRIGLAIALSPLFLLSKKRKHYLTIYYVDRDGASQAAVFELGKKIVRSTLASLEARTGLRVEYQDEEARRAGGI